MIPDHKTARIPSRCGHSIIVLRMRNRSNCHYFGVGALIPLFAQQLPDVPKGECGNVALEARCRLKLGPFVLIDLRHFGDRYCGLPGEERDYRELLATGTSVRTTWRTVGITFKGKEGHREARTQQIAFRNLHTSIQLLPGRAATAPYRKRSQPRWSRPPRPSVAGDFLLLTKKVQQNRLIIRVLVIYMNPVCFDRDSSTVHHERSRSSWSGHSNVTRFTQSHDLFPVDAAS
jgi:hypothetical protein